MKKYIVHAVDHAISILFYSNATSYALKYAATMI